uniref:Reverse transcriptase domain-containing protein n=1 Tax=Anolis carolinensis TaxID=28377 RepID=A0A803SYC2_ANOCA
MSSLYQLQPQCGDMREASHKDGKTSKHPGVPWATSLQTANSLTLEVTQVAPDTKKYITIYSGGGLNRERVAGQRRSPNGSGRRRRCRVPLPFPSLSPSTSFLRSLDVDKNPGAVRATACALEPRLSWLLKQASGGLVDWFVRIINASLEQSKFPSCLKQSIVRPVLKKASLDSTVLSNFRPISNLPFLGKVLEWMVASQLQGFLEDTDFLDRSQSGFRPGFSTETALVALVDDLRRELDRGRVTLLVLLDISAAFDTIDHGILLGRLSGMGLGGSALQWLQSFLEGRSQLVKLGDTCSDPWPLTCGVPQGSILSPLLFNIYMKPLGEVIRSFGVRCHLYADDTQLYYSFPPNSKEAPQILDQCLVAVMGWMRVNKLKLNPVKTEVLQVNCKSDRGIGWQPVLDGVALPLKAQVHCSLGVLLDSGLTLEAQVSAVAGRAFAQLKLVRQLRPYLEKSDLAMVVHALVTSRLDYCNALYVGLPLKTARKLQLVQHSAALVLMGARYRERSTLLFKELHWLPFIFRAQFKVQIITSKALNALGPTCLRDRISPYELVRSLRSSGEALLSLPSASQSQLVGTREREGLLHRGPHPGSGTLSPGRLGRPLPPSSPFGRA